MRKALLFCVSAAALSAMGCGDDASTPSASASTGGDDLGLCLAQTDLALETFVLRDPVDPKLPAHPDQSRHIAVAGCEAYELYWLDEPDKLYWQELVTNCAPENRGGPAESRGFSKSCLLDMGGAGGEDGYPRTVSYAMGCVCCDGGVCGHYCHEIPNPEGGGGTITCADYNYDFSDPSIGDPREHPELCDCTTNP